MKKTFSILLLTLIPVVFSFTPEKTIDIKVTIPQAQIILKALSKLPYEESAQLITEIQMQAQKQLADSSVKK